MKTQKTPEELLVEVKAALAQKEKEYDSKAELQKAMMILQDAKLSGKHWVLAFECCNENYTLSNGVAVWCSHRMPARLTDCYQTFPDRFEARRVGRYVAYRAL